MNDQKSSGARDGWTFLSNHAHVLIAIARDPEMRVRDVAQLVGITERAVMQILADLEMANVVRRHRHGRRNTYEVHTELPLRHPLEHGSTIADIIALSKEEVRTIPTVKGEAFEKVESVGRFGASSNRV